MYTRPSSCHSYYIQACHVKKAIRKSQVSAWTLTVRYPLRSMREVFVFCSHCPHNRESSAKETQRELVLHGKNVFIPSPMSCALQPDALQHPASFSRHCLLLCFSIPGRCSCFCHPYYNRVCYVKAARLGLLVPILDKILRHIVWLSVGRGCGCEPSTAFGTL